MTATEDLLTGLRGALAAQQDAVRRGDLDQLSRALADADGIRARIRDLRGVSVDQAALRELLDLSRGMEKELEDQLDTLQAEMKDLGAARQGLQRLRSSLRTPRPEARFLDHQA